MDGYDVNTVAVKGARNVERLASDVRHEQNLWIGLVVGMLFNDVAGAQHMLEVDVRDFPKTHALLGVPADEIAVFLHGLAQGGDIDVGHSF
jgi:hypothetical protein